MAPKSVADSGDPRNVFLYRIKALRTEVDGLMWALFGIADTDFEKTPDGRRHMSGTGGRMVREMVRSVAYRVERFAVPKQWEQLEAWAEECGKLGVPKKGD